MNDTEKAHLCALHALRAHHAKHLDAGTAELRQFLVSVNDPYGDHPPVSGDTKAWHWFAKVPGGTHWLLVDDLPEHTAGLIRRRMEIEHLAERPRPLPSGGHWT